MVADIAAHLQNCTPHVITIYSEDGVAIILPPSGIVARVSVTDCPAGLLYGIPVLRRVFGAIVDLPDSVDGKIYIVSALVADQAHRPDVVSPGPLIRNDQGQVVGCQGLSRPYINPDV